MSVAHHDGSPKNVSVARELVLAKHLLDLGEDTLARGRRWQHREDDARSDGPARRGTRVVVLTPGEDAQPIQIKIRNFPKVFRGYRKPASRPNFVTIFSKAHPP